MKAGSVFWFTGLSGSGKTTIAVAVRENLARQGIRAEIIDGDAVRATYARPKGFSKADVRENNFNLARLCQEARANCPVVLVPVISPYRDIRADVRAMLSPGFFEVFVNASLACVKARDVKGLYARAERGEIKDMIGLSPENPYEAPTAPDLMIASEGESPKESVSALVNFIKGKIAC